MTDETPAKSRVAYIAFTDSAGQQWLAWKVAEAAINELGGTGANRESPSLGKAWLVFLSPTTGETRRTAPVPEEWRTLSVPELERLVREAKPFRRRK